LNSYIENNWVQEVDQSFPQLIHPIHVLKQKGKCRLIVDTRLSNAWQPSPFFRLETLEDCVKNLLEQHDFLATTDLKKAYYSLPLHPDSQPYACIRSEGKTFAFKVVNFGQTMGPIMFTKIMREPVKFLRHLGISLTTFYDDILWVKKPGTTPEVTMDVFTLLGFQFNEKCKKEFTTEARYLGMTIDTKEFVFKATREQLEEIKASTTFIKVGRGERNSIFLWEVLALRLAVQPARVFTRTLYQKKKKKKNGRITLTQKVEKNSSFGKQKESNGTANQSEKHRAKLRANRM